MYVWVSKAAKSILVAEVALRRLSTLWFWWRHQQLKLMIFLIEGDETNISPGSQVTVDRLSWHVAALNNVVYAQNHIVEAVHDTAINDVNGWHRACCWQRGRWRGG